MSYISRTDLISKLEGLIHDCLKDQISPDEPVAILDFPDIRNCGDSAIWLGEMSYLRKRFGKRPAYISRQGDFSAEMLERRAPTGPIFIQGGGTFGDIWRGKQEFREAILERFPNRRIVHFPQSIHYNSLQRAEQMARVIAKHKHFILLVRDLESKEFADKHFDCEVRLCPDMAFANGPLPERKPEFPVLAMLRGDVEKARPDEEWTYPDIPSEDWINESKMKVRLAKLEGALAAISKPDEFRLRTLDAAAQQRFERGISQIARGKAIVTDRLHVHICSLLLGRPHAVLDNSYGKIRNHMEAFSGGTELSYRATSLKDGIEWARAQAATTT